jgi:5-methylcytosine-specific restriction endonuclease McrA
MPLALGGGHVPRNLQLLCPRCNVAKQAKHPLDYMRQIGRLL